MQIIIYGYNFDYLFSYNVLITLSLNTYCYDFNLIRTLEFSYANLRHVLFCCRLNVLFEAWNIVVCSCLTHVLFEN